MPVIKPRTRGKQLVRYLTRLDHENLETLYAYAHFLGESTEYIVNELIDAVLAKDKDFRAWRTEHLESYVPTPRAPRRHRSRRREATRQATAQESNAALASAGLPRG
jgi:hypothetical protein